MVETASTDVRALSETASNNNAKSMADAQAKLQKAESTAEQIVAQAQLKANEIISASRENSQAEAATLRNAAIAYRDNVLGSLDVNNEIFEDLRKRITDLRTLWFDKANEHLRESEESVSDLLTRFATGRVTITNTFSELPAELNADKTPESN
jgi:ribosomal protein L20